MDFDILNKRKLSECESRRQRTPQLTKSFDLFSIIVTMNNVKSHGLMIAMSSKSNNSVVRNESGHYYSAWLFKVRCLSVTKARWKHQPLITGHKSCVILTDTAITMIYNAM